MDASRFDRIVKGLCAGGTRRGVLHLLTALPLIRGLTVLVGEEAAAKRERKAKRRVGVDNHKHGGRRRKHKNHHHKHKNECKPESLAQTCAEQCGSVKNNCNKTVDCGMCECDPACARAPEFCCGGACTDTDTDPDHCGSCGTTCSGDTPVCWDGACVCGDVCPSGCQFIAVQDAIDTGTGSTFRICVGTYGRIVVSKNLTLIGVGDGADQADNTILTILAGQPSGSVMSINPGLTVTLEGLRITGGVGAGGGIRNDGNLTMTTCTVTGNMGAGAGGPGGIFSFGPLSMTDCTVSGNTGTAGNAGGIRALAGLSLTRCTIAGNHGFAGGLAVSGPPATLTDTTVEGNSASNNGGGIHVAVGDLTLIRSSVHDNTAVGFGGGISNIESTVTLTDSSVSGNMPDNCGGIGTGTYIDPDGGCAAP